jgi:protein-S-isoprenylcysteine O-methyltransferase Ste14
MKKLNKQAFAGLANLIAVLALALFLPAWTFRYWQAWLFLATFTSSVMAITLYLMKKDPALLARRTQAGPVAEKEISQKIIQSVAAIGFIAIFIVSSIDHRFSWSRVPGYVSIAGDGVVALGLLVVFLVFKENTFTSAVVEVDAAQSVVSTGPYSVIRHPMYVGALFMLLGVPVALGSWWGVLAIVPIALALAWRLVDEETFLEKNLPGYQEYRAKVKYRLVPLIW